MKKLDVNEVPIGELVRLLLPNALETLGLTAKEVENLEDKAYSKEALNVNYPVLKKHNPLLSKKENIQVNGRNRYYANAISFGSYKYYITNDWYVGSKPYFVSWYRKHLGEIDLTFTEESIPSRKFRSSNKTGRVEERIIEENSIGNGYDSVFGKYLNGAKEVLLQDTYIRATHQMINLVKFIETCLKFASLERFTLITKPDADGKISLQDFDLLKDHLDTRGIKFDVILKDSIHDRELYISSGFKVILGRGLDYFKNIYFHPFKPGCYDNNLFHCRDCSIHFLKQSSEKTIKRIREIQADASL